MRHTKRHNGFLVESYTVGQAFGCEARVRLFGRTLHVTDTFAREAHEMAIQAACRWVDAHRRRRATEARRGE